MRKSPDHKRQASTRVDGRNFIIMALGGSAN